MNFLETVLNSIYSPNFYKKLPGISMGKAIKYFLVIIAIHTFILVGKASPDIAMLFPRQLKDVAFEIDKSYPSNLVVTVDSGKISTNSEEPVFILDKDSRWYTVIDTKTPYSVEKFGKFGTKIWVTSDSIFYKDGIHVKSRSVSKSANYVFDKDYVSSFINKLSPMFPLLGALMLLFSVVSFYIFDLFGLVYIAILSLVVWIILKIIKRDFEYKDTFKILIYATTLPYIIDSLRFIFGLTYHNFLFTLITVVVVFINLFFASKSNKIDIARG